MTIFMSFFAYFYGSVLRQHLGSTRTISLNKKVFSPFFNCNCIIPPMFRKCLLTYSDDNHFLRSRKIKLREQKSSNETELQQGSS